MTAASPVSLSLHLIEEERCGPIRAGLRRLNEAAAARHRIECGERA